MTVQANDMPQPATHDSLAVEGVAHGFFGRKGGVSGGIYGSLNCGLGSQDKRESVATNRHRVAKHFGADASNLLTVYQCHSADAIAVSEPFTGSPPKLDGMATKTPGLVLGALAADCAPLLFADPVNKVIGAAHAGWRGAFTGVAEATIDAMESLGANRTTIRAVIGPTISKRAYEVGPEFVERFTDATAANESYFGPSENEGHAYFDLPGYLVDRLKGIGLSDVASLDMCTYSNQDAFFSYRRATHLRERDYGRMISAIMIAA